MCCAIKPMVSWHLNETVNVCRERCGGQGYLSVNRFGEFFGAAHAGMTAEGDNSVLMQKVAKEHLAMFKPHELTKPSKIDLDDLNHLEYLLKERENWHYNTLRGNLGPAVVYTKVAKKIPSMLRGLVPGLEEKGVFSAWMYREQDLVQSFARSYAERLITGSFRDVIKSDDVSGTTLEPILNKVLKLYLLTVIENDLTFFLERQMLNTDDSQLVNMVLI